MVLRKQTPHPSANGLVPAPLSQAVNNPPYPTTPADEHVPQLPPSSTHPSSNEPYSPDLNTSPAFNLKPLNDAQKKEEESDSDYTEDWDRSDDEEESAPKGLPDTLKIGGGKPIPSKNTLPDALRAGPPPGAIRKPAEMISPEPTGASVGSTSSHSSIPLQTNNPYLRMQATGQSNYGGESSAQVWGDMPSASQKYGDIAELPATQSPIAPTAGMSMLSLNSNVTPVTGGPFSPDQPPLIAVDSPSPQSAHPRQDSTASSAFNPGADISSLDAFSRNHGLPMDTTPEQPQRSWEEQQNWERSERERRQKEIAAAHEAAQRAEQEWKHEQEWHAGEQNAKLLEEEFAPSLPSRQEEQPPVQPPRPSDTAAASSSAPQTEAQRTAVKDQTKEFYKIKNIRWYDATQNGIRISPILTQNANGPCPLLALVNALVLSTPANEQTALVETLRTREQVSLGLLLDAVFDELMSGRRGGAAQELPDVSELYTFLVTLHTGMNVNPMYVQDPAATDGPSALIPSLVVKPGGFENTREMRLYKTFNVPLMHGWLPESGSEAYIAFERVAKTYEDAQHAQFQEEELERKLVDDGLSPDEQTLFTDLIAIKEFLTTWPTQLTTTGLDTIKRSVQPGQIGILFRNDHFSTLYKHPRTGLIMTLVTDAGYATHDEIVWESLVDVNGQGSELFSGDFRPVGNHTSSNRPQSPQPIRSLLDVDDNQGWTTVQSRRSNNNNNANQSSSSPSGPNHSSSEPPSSPTGLSKTEQEDHDLALALQLQEEEEDRHRRSLEARRQSQSTHPQSPPRPGQQQSQNPPLIPPRRSNLNSNVVPVHRPNEDPAPPPTYEEASSARPYVPGPGGMVQGGGSAYAINNGMNSQQGPMLPPRPGQQGNRPGPGSYIPGRMGYGANGQQGQQGVVGGPGKGRDKGEKCVVM